MDPPIFPLRPGANQARDQALQLEQSSREEERGENDIAVKRRKIGQETLEETGKYLMDLVPRKKEGWTTEPSSDGLSEDSMGMTRITGYGAYD